MTIFKIPIPSILLGMVAFALMAILSYFLRNDADVRNYRVLDGGVFVGCPMTMWSKGGFSTGGSVMYKIGAVVDFACAIGAGHLVHLLWLALKKRQPNRSDVPPAMRNSD